MHVDSRRSWLPRATLPIVTPAAAITAVLEDLRELAGAGRLTGEAFDDAFARALDAAVAIDDDDERVRLLDPVLDVGASVGRMRE